MSTVLLPSSPTNPENPTTESPTPNPVSTVSQIPNGFTPEDARFFNSLYALNVPPTDIVTMMETLRVEREAAANANRIWQ